MTWKIFQKRNARVIIAMFKQLKQDMNICQENKNEELNVMQTLIEGEKIEFNKEMQLLRKCQSRMMLEAQNTVSENQNKTKQNEQTKKAKQLSRNPYQQNGS